MSQRPLANSTQLELLDIVNNPDKYTSEIIDDAQQELVYRQNFQKKHPIKKSTSGGFKDILLFKTELIALPVIIWMNIVAFLIAGQFGASYFDPHFIALFKVGGMQKFHFLEGDSWRTISSMFLHSGLMHLGFNMFALLQVGSLTENLIGKTRFTIIYFSCGIMGSYASISFGSDAVGVGASGAVFGIFGMLFMLLRSNKVRGNKSQIQGLAKQLGFFIVLNIVIGLSSKGISNSAHMGGLITGIILSQIHLFNYPRKYQQHGANILTLAITIFAAVTWHSLIEPKQSFISEVVKLDQKDYEEYEKFLNALYYFDEAIKNKEEFDRSEFNHDYLIIKDVKFNFIKMLDKYPSKDFNFLINEINNKTQNLDNYLKNTPITPTNE